MLRYRLLYGLLLGTAMTMAFNADHGKPIYEHYGVIAVLLAYYAGIVIEKYPAPPPDPNVKSFRLHKGHEKW